MILFVVIARGGSKGVPRKNVRLLDGLPLVSYKIVSGKRSRYCSRLILSSEDAEIQQIGREYGAEVPFTRPVELAGDTASSDDVLLHAMEWVEKNDSTQYEAVMLLEPSSPFGRGADYDAAVELMRREGANLVVGMTAHKLHPVFIGEMAANGNIGPIVRQLEHLRRLDRQALPRTYTMNGAFYLMRWDHFRKVRRRYVDEQGSFGVAMEPFCSIEIDEPVDFEWAEFLLQRGLVDRGHWH